MILIAKICLPIFDHNFSWGWFYKDQRLLGFHSCRGGSGVLTFNMNRVYFISKVSCRYMLKLCVCVMLFQEKSSGRQAHYKLTSTAMLWLQV